MPENPEVTTNPGAFDAICAWQDEDTRTDTRNVLVERRGKCGKFVVQIESNDLAGARNRAGMSVEAPGIIRGEGRSLDEAATVAFARYTDAMAEAQTAEASAAE